MPEETFSPARTLEDVLQTGDAAKVDDYLWALQLDERARQVSRLDEEDRTRLMALLPPEDAAALLEELADESARQLLEAASVEQAAQICDEIHSDVRVDLLAGMTPKSTDAIVRLMQPEEAEDVRDLISYASDTAGGLMITEYLYYTETRTVGQILDDLRAHGEEYGDYDIQYAYITDEEERLTGVLRMRDLLFSPRARTARDVMITKPVSVKVSSGLDELTRFFDDYRFFGVPVTEENGELVGVLRRSAVDEASAERANKIFLRVSGIVGGEEFRDMGLTKRFSRRLSFLSINIVLNIAAASVIALNMDTLDAVIALAVFMPIISDMSGCSGNQAVAVSIRELALGLVKPREFWRVFVKEFGVGMINGIALGVLLGLVAFLWKGNMWLGVVVGGALALNTLIAVCFGGLVPLLLKSFRLDPALVSGPVLTTVTDMCGFFLVLTFASFAINQLVGL